MNIKTYLFFKVIVGIAFWSCTNNSFSQNIKLNFDTAYLKKIDDSIMITILGKRQFMVHDVGSLAKREKYYIDSVQIKIPDRSGTFSINEIRPLYGGYPLIKGSILIKKDSIYVDYYYNNYDDKRISASTWNGRYLIQWRQ